MKRALILLTLLCLLSLPTSVFAHMPGQPSFFVVNGKYADFYPGVLNGMPDPNAPQDIGPEKYEADKPIRFETDTTKFPQATPEQVAKTKFSWDFGDEAKGSGLKNQHTYTKPGKYVLKIMADDGTTPVPQLFESIELTIIQNKEETQKEQYLSYGIGGVGVITLLAIVGIIMRKKK